ncbi:MAG: Crp/Fnr family transcriptional regulator [Flavobacteriales bacterium Tduv]
MSNFINFFEKFHPEIIEEEREWLKAKIYEKLFRKNEIITQVGEVADDLYLIEEGVAAIIEDYYKGKKKEDKDEFSLKTKKMSKNKVNLKREFVLDFKTSGDVACVYSSFLTRKPAKLKLVALSLVKAQAIKYDMIQELYKNTSWGERVGRKIAEELLVMKYERERILMRYSATERYLRLLHTRPELFKRIPLKYIAAHIPISQQAFCRLRNSFSEV